MTYGSILKVISGGQTGADQGGLMAAWDRGIQTGGWAPFGYRTTIGANPLLQVLGLEMTDATNYQDRTCRNVEMADATLVFGFDLTSPGSRQTIDLAMRQGKPVFKAEYPIGRDVDYKEVRLVESAVSFILQHRPVVVNVAGNRDTDANNANFTTTRRVFGLILDLVNQQIDEQP